MKILDKIALNRALKILADFIIKMLQLFNKQSEPTEEKIKPKPKRPLGKILPWRNNDK